MPSTMEAVDVLAARVGFDKPRVRAVARSLTDAGRLPPGAPAKSPMLDISNVVDLLIGCAVDVPLRAVAYTVAKIRELTPAGTPISALPASLQYSAGNYLDSLSELAAEGSLDVRRVKLEFVSNWNELAVHQPDGTISRFVDPGANPAHWQQSGHRKSVIVSGMAFADAVTVLFKGK
ncbi:hypothetical protein OOJ09_18970 [Mesorhizobium qingshengii]|uniref:Uncharacterized protein n=1 Tax=Mesorhizobium qingshengii TaxID=1165689 RepID=A0ABT4QXG6_9HYPH|nr:hypothetical protein [Mesorhizobium qingshengii]MCZ8546276.1 hypothetical protein [Mesorhizobium qingshengii]